MSKVEIYESGRSYEIRVKLPPGYRVAELYEIKSDEKSGDLIVGIELKKIVSA